MWNSRLLIVPFNAKILCQQLSAILYTIKSTFIRSPTLGYAIVLHAAIRLLEQAQPQILCTQIVNYNPSKALQSKNFVFTVLGYSLKVWFVKLRGYF